MSRLKLLVNRQARMETTTAGPNPMLHMCFALGYLQSQAQRSPITPAEATIMYAALKVAGLPTTSVALATSDGAGIILVGPDGPVPITLVQARTIATIGGEIAIAPGTNYSVNGIDPNLGFGFENGIMTVCPVAVDNATDNFATPGSDLSANLNTGLNTAPAKLQTISLSGAASEAIEITSNYLNPVVPAPGQILTGLNTLISFKPGANDWTALIAAFAANTVQIYATVQTEYVIDIDDNTLQSINQSGEAVYAIGSRYNAGPSVYCDPSGTTGFAISASAGVAPFAKQNFAINISTVLTAGKETVSTPEIPDTIPVDQAGAAYTGFANTAVTMIASTGESFFPAGITF